jgi:hypothetical protein
MIVILLVNSNKCLRVASIETSLEDNGRGAARSKAQGGASPQLVAAGYTIEFIALILLSLALCLAAGEGTTVGCIGALVVLHRAGSLKGSR